ncbi:tRNA(adenine(34)) deaminase, chloroplastic-like isoform X1 [Telopea speciosissima]|uniref:tRNA(adenine(34)) deaminase, chloroplastic-like isoform X1 n=1 Tax=Telopea speciosissima TaxID=54955 RepID=UPI001CC3D1C2|nr:tRNA(adenine(34)) deaminase, chloroplastic-like isoform X1 [Telopea speciosissima]
MHNTYLSSMSLWRKGSLSFSFNDNCYFLSERTENPSSSTCTCCALSNHGLPIYPRFLYGLRHSSLIQWSASGRLILAGFDRYCRLPLYDLDRGCYGVSCSLKESSVCRRRRRRRRGEGKFGCMGWEERSESCDSGTEGSAEAMLSLLTEEISDKFVGRSAARRELVEKIGRVLDERPWKEKECVQTKSLEWDSKGYHQSGWSEASSRTENHGLRIERPREKKDCAQASSSERNSKGEYKSSTVKSREDYYQLSGRRGASSRTENHGLRREGSGSSSYHSALSSGDIESDTDVEVKHAEFVGESSGHYMEKELRSSRGDVLGVNVRKQFKRHDEDVSGYREFSRQRNGAGSAVGSNKMMSGHEWDSRSKAEKKITEVSVAPVQSREESSQRLSRKFEVNDSGMEMGLSHQKRFSGREDDSISAVNLVEKTTKRNSQSGRVVLEHAESRRKSQQVQKMSEIQGSDFQRASSSQKQFSGREVNLSSPVNLDQVGREGHRQTFNETVEQTELRRKSRQLTKVTEDSNTERPYTSQMLFETQMDNREENSTTNQSSIQKSNEQQAQINQRFYGTAELRRESQDLTNEMTSDASETITRAQTLSETRVSGRERNSASVVVDLVHEERQSGSRTGEGVIEQVGLRKESQRPMRVSSFPRSSMERASSSTTPLYSVPHARVQLMGVSTEDDSFAQVMLAPPSQLVGVKTGYATIEASGEFSESSSSSLFTHPQAQTPASPHELHVETRTNEAFGENPSLVHHEDVLGSANRFERSSSQFVGEFVEKVQDEIFTSEFQKERTSETTSAYGDRKYIQQGPGQYVSEDLQLKRADSRRSSDVSGKKGPSDEMWDVKDPTLHGYSQREAPEEGTSTTGSAIVRRTGRSFWNIIADVVRMRWGTRSETNNSALKSGGKSSSNESIGSEVWFSGHEPDDNDSENVKKRQRGTPKECRSADQLSKASTQSQTEASEATISQDRIFEAEADASSYSGTLGKGVTSQGTSSASGEERFGWKEDGRSDQGIPSTVAPMDSSLSLLTRRLLRSPVIERMPESSKAEVSIGDFKENVEQSITERLTEVPKTDGKDEELKRRKFQRTKQVPKDRFDEWENAYKLETVQRENDEKFMREALLEAQKAADIWEVPVGAVLVQNGEIIARGYNLVEELRDSTAHAEMICIREASNLLRTWRLADTTLYVTLEPCPMCAGAILQARIDTVVWGAPNKLLGADGSWVRLFPGGGEGESSSDQTNQLAGPIHPFHSKITIRRGVLERQCADAMQQFFHLRRKKKEKNPEPEPQPPEPQPSCLPVSTHPSKFFSKMHDMFSIMFCL